MKKAIRRLARTSLLATSGCILATMALAQENQGLGQAGGFGPGSYGPFNVEFPAGGDGIIKPKPQDTGWPLNDLIFTAPSQVAPAAWTLYGWVQAEDVPAGETLLGGFDTPDQKARHFLSLLHGKPSLRIGDYLLSSDATLQAGTWNFVAATVDGGAAHLYVNGVEVGHGTVTADDAPLLPAFFLGPRKGLPADAVPFAGRLANFTALPRAVSASEIKALASQPQPDMALTVFQSGSPHWPIQVRQMYGQLEPQDPWTRPKSKAPFSEPVAKPLSPTPSLRTAGAEGYVVGDWRLAEAPKVSAAAPAISKVGFDASPWYAATVPGTVLTTLVDRGVYPNPDYGLNNLAIPESLNKQDYWYRTEFVTPDGGAKRHFLLTFKGINYFAEIWLNGEKVGTVKGAFIRGQFDVTPFLKPGQSNALAVKISPTPHPGLAHEESLTAGVGENGGMGGLDGPTFAAAEGWDWIPSVRDRNSGLWQDVLLRPTGDVRLGDSQVVTSLPFSDNHQADIEVTVPVQNVTDHPVQATVSAQFDDVHVSKMVTLAPGESSVRFTPSEFPQLSVQHPKLWWPNGYGDPTLHKLAVVASANGEESDRGESRFGIRQVTYETSLMDHTGHLRRVELDLTKARARGEQVVDVRHEAIRKVSGGWVTSLVPGAENSPAVKPDPDTRLTPYLILKVNGVRIAARGGSWGMDDWRKRVSRANLEPYFRLHRDAHINIIRNWIGQNTEEAFYDLADEYGLMVLNDFWDSTQDYNVEPQDVPLFLANAADTIAHFRNHPSIVLWFGRNEGVPQPILNEGLDNLVRTLDGTRYYTGSSNRINLQDSGPYSYQDPSKYFTTFNKGFSVEVGTPSFPTLEAFKAYVPEPDRWPVSDVWAYHDWHQIGNGGVGSFMTALDAKFGAASDLEDFERKAQMMNYVNYRAIFEGMNAELWTKTAGRLLWMTQPAWPSSHWQILSHDYDTHAAYYGVQKASEIVHVQMNLPNHDVAVINNTVAALPHLVLTVRVVSIDNRLLLEQQNHLDAAPNAVTAGGGLALDPLLASEGTVLVKLALSNANGQLLSDNFYWVSKDDAATRRLNELPAEPLALSAAASRSGDDMVVTVTVSNPGPAPALMSKLTLEQADGSRILPAYYDANYLSLLPGDSKVVTISYPATASPGSAKIAVRGWNVKPAVVEVAAPR